MLAWLYRAAVRRIEVRYRYDAAYLTELIAGSPRLFRRFIGAQTKLRAIEGAPKDAWHAAALGAALHEDCGPCVQIATDLALEAGLPPDLVRALLAGEAAQADAQLGFDFARALCSADPVLELLRAEVLRRWGLRAAPSLAFAVLQARGWPVLKRAMGYAQACVRVRVAGEAIVPRAKLAA